MKTDKGQGHELSGPHAHERGGVRKSRLERSPGAGGRFDLFWLLVMAAIAATGAGIYLAIRT
jgi:hypothetical protein